MIALYIIIALVIWGIVSSQMKKTRTKRNADLIKGTSGFTATEKLLLNENKFTLALDEPRKLLCMITPTDGMKIFSKEDVLQVTVELQGDVSVKGAKTGALIGGLVGGVEGAVVGMALNAKEKTKIKTVDLVIVTKRDPEIKIPFFNFGSSLQESDIDESYKKANHWKLKIENL